MPRHGKNKFAVLQVVLQLVFICFCRVTHAATPIDAQVSGSLWSHDNLIAWCVGPYDANKRGPEERAQMLQRLGFRSYAHLWFYQRREEMEAFDAEIEALKKYGINPIAWYFQLEPDDPAVQETLEKFKRHGIRPQLWVPQSSHLKNDLTKTPQEQENRIRQETARIQALVKLAAPYGIKVALYNHNGWFGMMDNQLSVLDRLRTRGITDVGIVYNFSHARDEDHDDTLNFSLIWKKIRPHVVAVNITGTAWEGTYIYPSQGDQEFEMMKIIQDSGWRGPIGLIAEKGGDAEITLRNYMEGLDWLAAELKQRNSGGMRPFPPVQQRTR